MGRREKNVVGLDIGSTKICTLIAIGGENAVLEPIGMGIAESRGIKRGAVVNLEAAVEAIKKSVSEAETAAGWEVETVYAGLAGPHIKSFNSRGVTSIPTRSREINRDDVRRVIETARAVALPADQSRIQSAKHAAGRLSDCLGNVLGRGFLNSTHLFLLGIVSGSATRADDSILVCRPSGPQSIART